RIVGFLVAALGAVLPAVIPGGTACNQKSLARFVRVLFSSWGEGLPAVIPGGTACNQKSLARFVRVLFSSWGEGLPAVIPGGTACNQKSLARYARDVFCMNPYGNLRLPTDSCKIHLTGFFDCGERGIRTLDTLSGIHAFQACQINHSCISPGFEKAHK